MDVEIRKPDIKEEFIIVIKKIQNSSGKSAYRISFGGIFVQNIAAARVYSDHFTNMAVYAVVIGDIIDTTRRMFHWNQNIILFLNRGAAAIMHMEIWKRFLTARDEVFKTEY